MERKRLLLTFTSLFLVVSSCGGGGGGGGEVSTSSNLVSGETAEITTETAPATTALSGTVLASVVRGARVCLEADDFSACTTTDAEGRFSLEVPQELQYATVRVESSSGVEVGKALVKVEEEMTITPITLADGSPTFAKLLKATIHALGGDPTGEAEAVDLSAPAEVEDAEGNPVDSVEEALKKGKRLKIRVGQTVCELSPASFLLSCTSPEGEVEVDCSKLETSYEKQTVPVAVPSTEVHLPEELTSPTPKKWVVVIYAEGDNDLQNALLLDTAEIAGALKGMADTEGVAVVELADSYSLEDGIYYSTPEGELKFFPYPGEIDGGNPETLSNFLKEVKEKFNPENVALILWNHGDGWRSTKFYAFDYNGGSQINTYMSVRQVVKTVKDAVKEGLPIRVVGFDSCEMGMAEVIWPLFKYAPTVEWVVASQLPEPAYGWDYEAWLKNLSPDSTPAEVAKAAVDAFKDYYENTEVYDGELTLGAFSRAGMENFVKALNDTQWTINSNYDDQDAWAWRERVLDQTAVGNDGFPFRGYADAVSVARALLDWNAENGDQTLDAVAWAEGVVDAYQQAVDSGDFYLYRRGEHDWSGIGVLFPKMEDLTTDSPYGRYGYYFFTDGQTYDYWASCNPETLTEETIINYPDGSEEYAVLEGPCNPFRNNYYFSEEYDTWIRDEDWVSLVSEYSSAVDSEPVVIVSSSSISSLSN